jgi:hypothetical protein
MGNFRDLRDWLKKAEEVGELKVVNEEVDKRSKGIRRDSGSLVIYSVPASGGSL